jgi:4-carboxymuconolactone decarboxylase
MTMQRLVILAALAVSALAAPTAWAEPGNSKTTKGNSMTAQKPATAPAETDEAHRRAREIVRHMLPPASAAALEAPPATDRFGGEFAHFVFENAFADFWARPGLSLKERSIFNIGMLVALGKERELAGHIGGGLKNGITPKELEEMIYQSMAYVGIPAASSALAVASKVVAEQQGGSPPTP